MKRLTRVKKRQVKALERGEREETSAAIMKKPRLAEKMLLIFDLNHVLLHRIPASLSFIVRPYAIEFIKKISEHFYLAVWTSGKRKNVSAMFEAIFNEVDTLFFWCQENCRSVPVQEEDSGQNGACGSSLGKKTMIFYKPLNVVWSEYPQFDASNTVSLIAIHCMNNFVDLIFSVHFSC